MSSSSEKSTKTISFDSFETTCDLFETKVSSTCSCFKIFACFSATCLNIDDWIFISCPQNLQAHFPSTWTICIEY
eukprot:05315.XXX_238201_238422_1 [CDS] Oithona nana genome sequencing.